MFRRNRAVSWSSRTAAAAAVSARGNDREVLELNRQAQAAMRARTELAIVRFAGPAGAWFGTFLANTGPAEGE